MRNIAVFTGTRADYGLLYWLLKDIESDSELTLQLIVSGMHLSPEFGLSIEQIKNDGFVIAEEIEILLSSDTPAGCAKSVGLGIISFTDSLQRLSPDLLIVLGDRFEALAIVQTAMILNIPIAHIHGGEITQGAKDDAFRHAITKLSSLHFTSSYEHSKRVVQLGEQPQNVFNVGALGLEYIHRTKLLSRKQLAESLNLNANFDFNKGYFLVTYHSVTAMDEEPKQAFLELLSALDEFPQFNIIITYPNADNGGRKIIPLLEEYAQQNSHRVLAIASLGQIRYLSAVKYAKAVIGNSSSGIIEVPSLNVASINIGNRQLGRLCAKSVYHCSANQKAITTTIKKMLSNDLTQSDENSINPYGSGKSAQKIINIIKSIKSIKLTGSKSFFNIPIDNDIFGESHEKY